jgi:hypothetical protein
MQHFIHVLDLPTPRTGTEIKNAVEAACTQMGGVAVVNQVYRNGKAYELGKASGYPYEQFRVTPSEVEEVFLGEQTYRQLVIADHIWPGMAYAVGYGPEDVVKSGVEFVNALTSALSD